MIGIKKERTGGKNVAIEASMRDAYRAKEAAS